MKIITGENQPELIPNPVNPPTIDNRSVLQWSSNGNGYDALDQYKTKAELAPIRFENELYNTSIIIDASYMMNASGYMVKTAIDVLRQAVTNNQNEIDVMHTNESGVIRHSSIHALSISNVRFCGKKSGLEFALANSKYNDIIFITSGLSNSGAVVVPEGKNLIVWDVSGSVVDYSAYANKTVSTRDPIVAVKEILQYYATLSASENTEFTMPSLGIRMIYNNDMPTSGVKLDEFILPQTDHDFSDEDGISILPQKIKDVTIVVDGSGSISLVEEFVIGVLKILPEACDESSVEIIHTFSEGIIVHPSVSANSVLEIRYASGGEGLSFAYKNAKYDKILLITDGYITDKEVVIPEGKKVSEWIISKPNIFETSYQKYVEDTVNDMIEHYNPGMQTRLETACMGDSEVKSVPTIVAPPKEPAKAPDWYVTYQWTTNMLAEFSDLTIDEISRLRRMAINNIFNKDNLDDQLTAMRSLYPYFK
jgi:hypothetical protein